MTTITHEQGLLFVIIENLELAIATVEEHPEQFFNLERYMDPKPCGTLFCTAGLLSTIPHFSSQGLTLSATGTAEFKWRLAQRQDSRYGYKSYEYLNAMFGHNSFDRLFSGRGCGVWDQELIDDLAHRTGIEPTDKELALARLQKQLDLVKSEFDPQSENGD